MKWKDPPIELELKENEIHIWCADLDFGKPFRQHFLKFLDPSEIERAEKFRFVSDRQHFLASRGILRVLLGHYLRVKPKEVEFRFRKFGKPFQTNDSSLEFNISHSYGKGVFAFVRNCEIGVDVECCERNVEFREIAKRFFSKNEVKALLELPEVSQLRGFYNCWTRKEAFIKALGKGLSFPLDEFEVSLKPEDAPELLKTHWDPDETNSWSLDSFLLDENCVGAIALRGGIGNLAGYAVTENFLRSLQFSG